MCLWAESLQKNQNQEYRKYWEHAWSKVGVWWDEKTPPKNCMQEHANINVLLGDGGWDQVKLK